MTQDLREVALVAALMGLTGAAFWIVAGGLLVLLGSPWLEP